MAGIKESWGTSSMVDSAELDRGASGERGAYTIARAGPTSRLPSPMLFLGNSYTFVNDLDVQTAALFAAGDPGWGDTPTERLAEAGYRWVAHVTQATTPGTAWEDALVTGDTA